MLAGLTDFTETVAFEAKCPNGVSAIPPHLDALLKRGEEIVGVESKCTEYLTPKTAKVAAAYLELAEKGDARAESQWFSVLREMDRFRHLDAYQLVKHYLGLTRCYTPKPLVPSTSTGSRRTPVTSQSLHNTVQRSKNSGISSQTIERVASPRSRTPRTGANS